MRMIVGRASIAVAKSILISMVLYCAAVCSGAQAAFVGPPPFDTRDTADPAVRAANYRGGLITAGLVLGAWLEQPIVGPKQPAILKLRLLSMSDQVLRLTETFPERDFSLIVRYEKRGIGLFPVNGLPIPPASATIERAIGPGQALEYTCRVDEMYDVSALGTYRITASRKVPRANGDGSADVLANTVYLKVSEDPERVQAEYAQKRSHSAIAATNADTNAAARTKSIIERRGLISEGFVLTAALEKSTVAPGQAVGLSLALDNCTPEVLRLWEEYPELGDRLIVLNARGDQLPPTRYGSVAGRVVWRDAQPWEMLAYTYGLNDMYDISAVGEYRITASRRVPRLDGNGWTEVVSNTVVLRVVEQP